MAAALATILAGWTVAHPAGTDGPSDGTPAPMLESPGRPECCRDDVQASLDPPSVGLEADVSQLPRQWRIDTHPVLAPDGSQIGTQDWRVVHGTGNCCENYLATDAAGRLMDLGGSNLYISSDEGRTWKKVPTVGGFNGEGAVVGAPGGDVIGMSWGLLTDSVQTLKYDAQSDQWYAFRSPGHTPFFDRPWLGVMKGAPGDAAPYMGLLRGGLFKRPVYTSLDGLRYNAPLEPAPGASTFVTEPVDAIPVETDPAADYSQPLTHAGYAMLPGGGAIGRGWAGACTWSVIRPNMTARCLEGAPIGGRMLVDSQGNLHNVAVTGTTVKYRISRDGGATWRSTQVDLPGPLTTDTWDFKANGAQSLGAVAVHADGVAGKDQDVVLTFDTSSGAPTLSTRYHVGDGDLASGAGFGCGCPRFDFNSVIILPDGTIAVSFADQAHHPPAVAILVDGSTTTAEAGGASPATAIPGFAALAAVAGLLAGAAVIARRRR